MTKSKRFAEAATMAYHRYHQVDTHIVRIFNTYGPRLQINDGRVISNFMKQALLGEDLTVYGDGSQTRSFCYVSDEVAGILALAKSDEHEPTNIGNPGEFTILECAKVVLEVTGSHSKIRFEPLPQDDPKQRSPDISKAKTIAWLGAEDRPANRPADVAGVFPLRCRAIGGQQLNGMAWAPVTRVSVADGLYSRDPDRELLPIR